MNTIAALLASVAAIFSFSPAATSTLAVTGQHCVTINRYLSVGATGTDVIQLQQFLGVKPTGFFGLQTQSALVKWQIASRIVATGRSDGAGGVGPKTRLVLGCIVSGIATTSAKVVPSVVPIITPPVWSAPTSSAIFAPQSNVPPPPTGGGGGSLPACALFTTPKPAASQCVTGEWVLISDEANCPVQWDCQNPNDPE